MPRSYTAKKRALEKNKARIDSLEHRASGMGTARDKLSSLNPSYHSFAPVSARMWYMSNGFIQNIIDAPAEDATREWITIRTNRDNDDENTGMKGLNISRLIMNRLDELGLRHKLKELIRYSRLYQDGGFIFYGIKADSPQDDTQLVNPMPSAIRKLDFINVFGPDRVSLRYQNDDPLSKEYHRPRFYVSGLPLDRSRMDWMVHSYIPEERRGVSVIDTILDAIKAQDVALWSVASTLFEMSVKVFKSPSVHTTPPEKLYGFLGDMVSTMSSQGAIALGDDEALQRIDSDSSSKGQIKQLFDFIFDNLAGLSRIPKSRLMGNAQGVITAGQFDLVSYYDTIAKFNELEVRPILEKIIRLVVSETEGEIYRLLGDDITSLDWEFVFNPLWKVGPVEQADIDLKNAQTDQIYITTAVLSPTEAKAKRFANLEQHTKWESAPINMSKPNLKLLTDKFNSDKSIKGQEGSEKTADSTETDSTRSA